jgi:hypothetical protein
MTTNLLQRAVIPAVIAIAAIFLSLHLYGSTMRHELWIFQSLAYTPVWYTAVWSALTACFCFCVWRYAERIFKILEKRATSWLCLAGLTALIAVFSYDTFVFGGGNLRIAQIAQVDLIIFHPHEFGTLAVVAGLFHLLRTLGVGADTAGVWGWRLFAFACSGLSIWGAIRLAHLVSPASSRRVMFATVTLFAGPFLMLCGFIGVEPIIVTSTIWFSIAAYQLAEKTTVFRLVILWGVCGLALFMAYSSAFLVPAAVCVSIASLWRRPKNWLIGGIGGLACLGGLYFLLYRAAGNSVAIAQYLVMPDGKLPLKDYTLLSAHNLTDKGLAIMVVAPFSLLLLVLVWRRLGSMTDRIFAVTIVVAAIAGRSAQIALDPINGIILDFPRLSAFLAPPAIALAFFLDRRLQDTMISRRLTLLVAGLSLLAPLAVAPVFTKIGVVEPLARSFAETHDHYYRNTGLAFRDAYFYKRNLDKANAWEWSLPIKSPDFLNMRGCYDLVAHGQNSDALVSLYRLVARQPFWAEPRALLVGVQLKLARPEAARPHLDTCLMLDPYAIQHLTLQYRYYQAIGQWDSAETTVQSARQLFPSDRDIATDDMVISFQMGQFSKADSLASVLLAADTASAYAHLIKGRLAERKGLVDSAASEYRRFIRTAPPGNPDIEIVGKRLSEIQQNRN